MLLLSIASLFRSLVALNFLALPLSDTLSLSVFQCVALWPDHHPQVVVVKAAQSTSQSFWGFYGALPVIVCVCLSCCCYYTFSAAVAVSVAVAFASHFLCAAVAAAALKTFCHSYNLPIVRSGRERATNRNRHRKLARLKAQSAYNGSSGVCLLIQSVRVGVNVYVNVSVDVDVSVDDL